MQSVLKIKKLHSDATAPTKATQFAAGFDLCALTGCTIEARCRMLVKTGLSIQVPVGTYGRIAPRSGLALKNGIDVMAGVIDADYRGDVGVVLINLGSAPFTVNAGDRIAHLILEKIEMNVPIEEVFDDSGLSPTTRGEGGFGSTGIS